MTCGVALALLVIVIVLKRHSPIDSADGRKQTGGHQLAVLPTVRCPDRAGTTTVEQSDLEKFRQSRLGDKMFGDETPVVHRVLVIVLSYLYSGREARAWQALTEPWPPSDQARVKSLILERRSRGLLTELGENDDAKSAKQAGKGQRSF